MVKLIAALIPYISVIIGLHIFSSAWLAFAIYHALVIIAFLVSKYNIKELFKGWNTPWFFISFAFGLCGGILMYLLWPYLNVSGLDERLAVLGLSGMSFLLFIFYHSIIGSAFEELLYRGFLKSDNRYPVLQDVLFACYHALVLILFMPWQWIIMSIVVLIIAGWFWRVLRKKTNGLLIPWLSHLAADACIMLVVYLKV